MSKLFTWHDGELRPVPQLVTCGVCFMRCPVKLQSPDAYVVQHGPNPEHRHNLQAENACRELESWFLAVHRYERVPA